MLRFAIYVWTRWRKLVQIYLAISAAGPTRGGRPDSRRPALVWGIIRWSHATPELVRMHGPPANPPDPVESGPASSSVVVRPLYVGSTASDGQGEPHNVPDTDCPDHIDRTPADC